MIPHYGKRDPGALTAASPGDTLYFAFASYNDSGDSEALTGFAVTDIEVFKNGSATARATDSGYSLVSDTGQVGDRVGLYRFSVQLFNTSDDTGYYDAGGWYQVAVDSVTIDGKTVRAWVGSFEIGTPRANVIEIGGDTGAATHLGALADEHDTGQLQAQASSPLDTGAVANAIWNSARASHTTAGTFGQYVIANADLIDGDTGAAAHLAALADEHDTGRLQAEATASLDTGAVANAVWNSARADHTTAGTFGQYVIANADLIDGDTGAAAHLASLADEYDTGRLQAEASATLDTGVVNQAVWQADASRTLTSWAFDTGVQQKLDRYDTGVRSALTQLSTKADTGIPLSVWASATRSLTAFAHDTGVADTVWKAQRSGYDADTGSVAYALGNVLEIGGDTGAAAHLGALADEHDTGRLQADASLDTGTINQAVWQADAARALTSWSFDTGVQQKLDRYDTGVRSAITQLSTKADTGVPLSVWASATRSLTAFAHDTGIADTVWKSQRSGYDADTGSIAYAVGNVLEIGGDTGAAAHLGALAEEHDTGRLQAEASGDTGAIATAVWTKAARTLTANTNLSGLDVNVTSFADTGVNDRLAVILADTDTGIIGSFTFTTAGVVDANIEYVNATQIQGTGDTGSNDTWRPV
jgi:hypothetical protein